MLSGSCCHQVRQNGKRHIFERDRRTVEQFQIIDSFHLRNRCNLFVIKLVIVGCTDTSSKFLFRKVGKKLLHHDIGSFLIIHPGKIRKRNRKLRNIFRHKEPSFIGESF